MKSIEAQMIDLKLVLHTTWTSHSQIVQFLLSSLLNYTHILTVCIDDFYLEVWYINCNVWGPLTQSIINWPGDLKVITESQFNNSYYHSIYSYLKLYTTLPIAKLAAFMDMVSSYSHDVFNSQV